MASGSSLLVHLYSEDGSRGAPAVLQALARRALQELEPHLPTQRLEFKPSSPARQAALTANRWWGRDRAGRTSRVELARDMATQLARGPKEGRVSLVLLHVDGDVPWSRRHEGRNTSRVGELRSSIGAILEDDELLRRFILVSPHYSIEAWTYQNITALRACVEADARTLDAARRAWLDRWDADPAALDEHDRPKEAFTDQWNLRLTERGWPVERARRADASFMSFVRDLGEVPGLRTALAALAAMPGSG